MNAVQKFLLQNGAQVEEKKTDEKLSWYFSVKYFFLNIA